MAAHVVAQPAEHHGLRDEAAGRDCEDGEVAHADDDVGLADEKHVADRGHDAAEHREEVAVLDAVRDDGAHERDDRGDDEDRDAHDLGADGAVAHLVEDRRNEEGGCVAGVDDAKVHQDAGWC